ncbi:MAG: ATP-dependent DNA helicase RecG [Acidobacteria bacterium]|nr:ATP-dependent DNA helicase RecG [Acidobacteriota bacterium]
MPLTLSTDVKFIKGVGPQRAEKLAERGIGTIEDLLGYLPFRYEDRIRFTPIRDLVPGQVATVLAEVGVGNTLATTRRFWSRRDAIYYLAVLDKSGMLHAKFFHGGYLEGRLKPGQRLVLHGKADVDPMRPARIEMVNPQIEILSNENESVDSTEVGRIVPIYEAFAGISSRMFRRMIYSALSLLTEDYPDPLPRNLRERLGFPARGPALSQIHFPSAETPMESLNTFSTPAHQRLIFEEFFLFQLGLALRRRNNQHESGIPFRVREDKVRDALKSILPFKPTAAQKRVLGEIAADLERPVPMNRLLEGDVGSGKTVVALESAVIAIENGYQVALMAPTEILAVQHFLSAKRILGRGGYAVELIISGLRPTEKRAALERVRSGAAQLVVGTHALIEEAVEFARLGLVIVDEQHRFGVMQRKRLIEKGGEHRSKGAAVSIQPDVLVMTATPIPRTLSMTLYGDLDISVIDELPPGRAPIETRLSSEMHLPGVWDFVRREVATGRQAYIVYPVIEESKIELKAAVAEFENLSTKEFPKLKVGLLHGRMKSAEKEEIMERFRRNELHVLVSTTVIEVGVDVPNATLMIIEHAERFGLAQLHQLRGRIGRGSAKSYCILIGPGKPADDARERLETMVRTSNGFEIAETDLRLRGPGEFFGTRQHGELGFHIANPLRDHQLLELARREAFALVESSEPAAKSDLRRLLDYLGPRWQQRYVLATVG